ncbi:MAG: NAD(P)-dependent oxidoreductase [Cytophagaceae bacterium]|nr:NAD(P)-dependent oxidoreductase [Gemmatimonadaceae bacterium]
MSHIAYIGTGLLGSAFVEAAIGRGDQVTVWNRTASKAHALQAFGAVVAATPADAVRGAVRVHLVLPDDGVVEQVIASLRQALAPGAVIVDHSTTLPATTAARSARLNAEGVNYLHCPVFIGPAAAREGKGIIMVAGRRDLFEQVQPALERQAERVEYLGERPDLAAVYKLCGNAFIVGMNGLVADVFSIASGAGVANPDALKLLEFFDPRSITAVRGKKMAARDYTATFELSMARKDVRLMIETAGERPLAMLPGLAARIDTLLAEGHAADDLAVIARDA